MNRDARAAELSPELQSIRQKSEDNLREDLRVLKELVEELQDVSDGASSIRRRILARIRCAISDIVAPPRCTSEL